ncbi:MAG TPA: asparagine synthase C-terminal domain-containing protein [Nitrosopumilaceae archaeon]|nr:asparagine synthase C-terminal domain-containing protein [Nitrosopumilaceae archaeon]
MGEFNHINPDSIKNALTLRYDSTQKTFLPKLTWKDFVEKPVREPSTHIEKTIRNTIKKNFNNSKLRVAIALSGGIDSTLILSLLRKTCPCLSIDAISVKFADSVDESVHAAKIAEKFEADHHVIYIENYLKELPKALSIIKLPFWDLHWYYVVKKTKSLSKTLVSGDGGDELFGGYTFRYKKFLSLIKPGFSPTEKVKAYLKCHERDWVPDQEDLFGKKAHFSWNEIYDTLKPYFDNPLPPIAQVFLADFNGKLLYNWTPIYTKIHKHFGVRSISPILSKELISYAVHLPYKLKYDNKRDLGKILLRKILRKYVSDSMMFKTKQGFSVNTINLLNSHGRELCDYYLSDARIIKEGWIKKEWVKKHIKKLDKNPDVRYVNKFLGLLAFEVWFRLFITKEIKPNDTLG